MRFVIHGTDHVAINETLHRHGHKTHTVEELRDGGGSDVEKSAGEAGDFEFTDLAELCNALTRRQWFLLTTDAAMVHRLFEQKVAYGGIIVLLIDAADGPSQALAIDRLFTRYKRLTPKHLYTVTANRVKVRQLPGAGG